MSTSPTEPRATTTTTPITPQTQPTQVHTRSDPIWYENMFILTKRPTEFFPIRGQSPAEQVNALVRLIAYISVAVYIYNGDARTLALGAVGILVLTLVYRGRGGRLAGLDNTSGAVCRQSTKENPFANLLVTEYGKPLPPKPCAYEDMKDDIQKNFNDGLPRNLEDWMERENSQREFLTVPNGGHPPDTRAFAEFLSIGMRNCKSEPSQCMK